MPELNFVNKQEFIDWVRNHGGRYEKNNFYLDSFSEYNAKLLNISDLNIIVSQSSHNSSLNIYDSKLNNIKINGKVTLNLEKVSCTGTVQAEQENLTINKSDINNLLTKARLEISDSTIRTLKHCGTNLICINTDIADIFIDSIHSLKLNVNQIDKCEIRNQKSVSDCQYSLKFAKHSTIILKECIFSKKAHFKHCDFSKSTLYTYDTSFQMQSYQDIKWFKKIRKINMDDQKTYIIPRDECRQLKNIAKKNENSIDEDYFKAYELHALMQELKLFSYRFDTKFTLILNNLSNRFGRSWLIPLVLILIVGLVFYTWYFHTTLIWKNSHECIIGYLKYYWMFINPIHSFYLFDKEVTIGLSFFVDTFHRILNYYLIYQFIAAFRKFGKA